MNRLLNAFLNMNDIDDCANGDSLLHHLHPLLKMFCSFLMIVFVLSTYRFVELLIYNFIVFVCAKLASIPLSKLMKRGIIGLPLSLCLGLSFLLFHHRLVIFYGMVMSEGILLCVLVFIKTFLCLCVAYLLIATTSFQSLASELIFLKVPQMFVLQLTMTYRYIFVFLREAQTMSQAYILRNPQAKGIDFKNMGSFVGHLLVNSMNESQSIYDCMKCRGFDVQMTYTQHKPFKIENLFFMMMILGVMIFIKVVCL